jgi:ABC-type cobalamin/Fe3+-siderophores transport system ATPase subunit
VRIYDLLKTIQTSQMRTILTVTHDINLAAQYCDQVLLLQPPAAPGAATLYRQGPPSQILTPSLIGQAFGVRGFSGPVGRQRFFLPLGDKAKDAHLTRDAGGPERQK